MNLSLSRSDDNPLAWLDQDIVGTLTRICESLEPTDGTVNLVVVDDAFIHEINARFRGVDGPTDVISFSYLDDNSPSVDDDLVGEVYVSHETIEKEATRLGVDVRHLFLRVGVHGLLHVLGHDHESDGEAERMERKEQEILTPHLGPELTNELL